jgi:uncharacterized lipoprotein
MRIAPIIVGLLAFGLLTGCKSKAVSCHQSNKDYAGAKELPPLKAPPGLEVPDTRNALKVPPLNTPERIRSKNEACLDYPPPFTNPKGPAPAPPGSK